MGALVDWYNNIQTSQQNVYHQPYETFSPTYAPKKSYQMDYSFAPTVQISSPQATGPYITSKKDLTQTGDVNPSTTGATDNLSSGQTSAFGSSNLILIALLLGGGLVAVWLISRPKK